jgi:hypothetical protein
MICLVLYLYEGISALVEVPSNCVVAAVGTELSEYDIPFLCFICACIVYIFLKLEHSCWKTK